MTLYTATATITLVYDSADGLVASPDDAWDDISSAIDSGEFSSDSYTIKIEAEEPEE